MKWIGSLVTRLKGPASKLRRKAHKGVTGRLPPRRYRPDMLGGEIWQRPLILI